MSSSNKSLPRERRRTPMACTNCRVRKLKCRPPESADGAPCERCVKERGFCEYRPVDPSSASSNHVHNYPDQDNPVNLYHVHSAPPPNQQSAPSVNQPYWPIPSPISGGYAPNQTFNPAAQVPFQSNPPYPAPPYQPIPSSYSAPQYPYPSTSGYPPGQSSYHQSSPQFGGHLPNQYISYAPAPGPYNHDQRGYSFNDYGNQMDGSNLAKE